MTDHTAATPATRTVGRRTIAPATRIGKKARIALSGPTGAGKTKCSLIIGSTLAPDGKMLCIDTERGSSGLYSDDFHFDTIDWTPPYDPVELAKLITEVASDYDVIIVDSLTHFWQGEGGTLDIVDAAGARSGGNKFAGWKAGTPAQTAMVDAMLASAAHVIVTMRSKMEYVIEQNAKGQSAPRKVGLAPIQREGLEYEFTVVGDIDLDHATTITKTRCDALTDRTFAKAKTADIGATLRDWLASNAEAPAPRTIDPQKVINAVGKAAKVNADATRAVLVAHGYNADGSLGAGPWLFQQSDTILTLVAEAVGAIEAAPTSSNGHQQTPVAVGAAQGEGDDEIPLDDEPA